MYRYMFSSVHTVFGIPSTMQKRFDWWIRLFNGVRILIWVYHPGCQTFWLPSSANMYMTRLIYKMYEFGSFQSHIVIVIGL